MRLGGELLAEEGLEGLAVLSELLDTLVELVERHRVLEEGPAELGLVVDERHLGDLGRRRGRSVGVELLRHRRGVVLELLEQVGADGQEVDTCEGFDLAGLEGSRSKNGAVDQISGRSAMTTEHTAGSVRQTHVAEGGTHDDRLVAWIPCEAISTILD